MEKIKSNSKHFFQLKSDNKDVSGHTFGEGRHLVGRAESCDLIISLATVSSIHAVIEVKGDVVTLYDMNSKNGTYVNGQKIVTKKLQIGDNVSFGNCHFKLGPYAHDDLPPVLESLGPLAGEMSIEKNYKLPTGPNVNVITSKPKTKNNIPEVPYVSYPLSLDPQSEYSEYIFEDAKELYPIFKYQLGKEALEVIIIHNDLVYSVDYIPDVKGKYYLKGYRPTSAQLEFPYLAKDEKINFIEINAKNYIIHNLHNYKMYHLSKGVMSEQKGSSVNLQDDDIVQLVNGDLEIYIRKVPRPPKIKTPPFVRLDNELKKSLLLVFLFLFISVTGISLFQVDKEKEEEKAPERIATILYKPKELTASKEKAVEKTENAPKVVQKAPEPKKIEMKKEEPTVEKTTPDPVKVAVSEPKPQGVKEAVKEQVVKKVENPAPPKKVVTPTPTPPKVVAKVVSPRPMPTTISSATNAPKVSTKSAAVAVAKSAGAVDVYKSYDFKSSVNTIMAKGGGFAGGAASSASSSSAVGVTESSVSGVDSRVKSATTNGNVGSLTGAASGAIGVSKGAEGLSGKKGIYTAGMPSEIVVLGGIDPDVIRRILQEHIPQFRYCYQKELDRAADRDLNGKVDMVFTIGASGHVTKAAVQGQSNLPSDVRGCVAKVLYGIQFPRPQGGGVVEVSQPFYFYPKKI